MARHELGIIRYYCQWSPAIATATVISLPSHFSRIRARTSESWLPPQGSAATQVAVAPQIPTLGRTLRQARKPLSTRFRHYLSFHTRPLFSHQMRLIGAGFSATMDEPSSARPRLVEEQSLYYYLEHADDAESLFHASSRDMPHASRDGALPLLGPPSHDIRTSAHYDNAPCRHHLRKLASSSALGRFLCRLQRKDARAATRSWLANVGNCFRCHGRR